MLLRGTKPKKVLASLTRPSPTPLINPWSPPRPTSTQPVMFSVWRPGQFCARLHTPRSVTWIPRPRGSFWGSGYQLIAHARWSPNAMLECYTYSSICFFVFVACSSRMDVKLTILGCWCVFLVFFFYRQGASYSLSSRVVSWSWLRTSRRLVISWK